MDVMDRIDRMDSEPRSAAAQRAGSAEWASVSGVDGTLSVRTPQSAHWKPLASFPVP